ncbi:hypothetical protein G9A89_020082 [Geosiphon pyriformis]|nr:hypothetical protein G9A89_020082 [Geosiphon pyriformis]
MKDASEVHIMIDNCETLDKVLGHLSMVKKRYYRSKYFEFRIARDKIIRKAINKCIENFCSDKSKMIKSVLNWPFRKVVLNHLVIDNKLVLEPYEIKPMVDKIMEEWTRVHMVPKVWSRHWFSQYASLDYVNDDAFVKIMCNISFNEFFQVVGSLPNGKAASLLGIPNEL